MPFAQHVRLVQLAAEDLLQWKVMSFALRLLLPSLRVPPCNCLDRLWKVRLLLHVLRACLLLQVLVLRVRHLLRPLHLRVCLLLQVRLCNFPDPPRAEGLQRKIIGRMFVLDATKEYDGVPKSYKLALTQKKLRRFQKGTRWYLQQPLRAQRQRIVERLHLGLVL